MLFLLQYLWLVLSPLLRVVESVVSDCMSIPAGWLCYLAPEVIRELRVHQMGGEDLPFTR